MKKILAISSMGGHWIQLNRLKPSFEGFETVYATSSVKTKLVKEENTYYLTDASRRNKLRLLRVIYQVYLIMKSENPDFVISTGAAPGVIAVILGFFFNKKTVWIDSIANSKQLSLSGKIAGRFATLHLTQWPELASTKTLFKGNIIS